MPETIDGPDIGPRIRQLRTKRGWSLAELGNRAGVSTSMLSEVERDRANPTLGIVHRIASAFGLTIDELLAAPSPAMLQVVRGDDPLTMFLRTDDIQIRTLSPLDQSRDIEFYEVRLRRGASLSSAAHPMGTRELVTVLQGTVTVRSADVETTLSQGDSAFYRADVEHAIINHGTDQAVVHLIDRYGD